jgi:hypothetical protein
MPRNVLERLKGVEEAERESVRSVLEALGRPYGNDDDLDDAGLN